jgi:hypothetical protein
MTLLDHQSRLPRLPGRRGPGFTEDTGLPELDLPGLLDRARSGEPRVPVPPPGPPRDRDRVPPRRGWRHPYGGRSANPVPAVVFRADTSQLPGLYPFLHPGTLPPVGAYIGTDTLTRQAFTVHPAAWVRAGIAANPNLLVTGIPGSGKSANVKALVLRLVVFGIRTLVAGDVKGEYTPLCRFLGTEPVRLGPGLPGRLNPLDAGPLGTDLPTDPGQRRARVTEIHRRRMTLLEALLRLQLPRRPRTDELAALGLAVREATGELAGQSRLTDPTIPMVYRLLRDPTPQMAVELRVRGGSVQRLRDATVEIREAIGAMVHGHLGGLFDTTDTPDAAVGLDFTAPIQSVDISGLAAYGEDTVAMALMCVSSWAQAAIDTPGPPRLVVRDEIWRQLRAGGAGMVAKIDADLRLSRAEGTIQVLATHRLSDFDAVGATGSAAANIARELIASCDTRVTLAQDTAPLRMTREAIGLTDAEASLIAGWGRAHVGRALWKIGRGGGSHPVQLHLTGTERHLFYTDERMT